MAKVSFDIKYRPQIESGEYKVVLDCGVEVEILAWDKPGEYPIVCMAEKDGAIPFRTDNHGIAYHYPEGSSYSDLFLLTSEPELTEFEKALGEEIFDSPFNAEQIKVIREESAKLLSLARKEIEEDLPRWKKCAPCDEDKATIPAWIVRFDAELAGESAVVHNGHYILFGDLEKLPKEE